MTAEELWPAEELGPAEPPDLETETDIGTYDDELYPTVRAGRDVDQSRHEETVYGDRYEAETQIFIEQRVAAGVTAILTKRRTIARTLAQQIRQYVPPPGMLEASAQLATDRILVLLCPAGIARCGQRAAAAFLINRMSVLHPSTTELDFREPLAEEAAELDEELQGVEHAGLFLDLLERGADPEVVDLLRQFGPLEERLPKVGSYAVLAVSDALADDAEKWFPGRVHLLRRPAGAVVFRAKVSGLPGSVVDALTGDEWFRAELREAWPPRAVELARLADRAYAGGHRDVCRIVEDVKGALLNWQHKARAEMDALSTAPQRALLLAAAMLEGRSPVVVVRAQQLLLEAGRYAVEPKSPLERTDVITELEALRATSLDAATTRFTRTDYGAAVLHLAWRDYPGLRDVILRWLERVPSLVAAGSPTDIDELTTRILALCVRDGNGKIAVEVARRWARESRPDTARRVAAVVLLRDACLNPRIGRDTRHRVYGLAYDRRSDLQLRVVLAEAVGAFDIHHQATAMTRLKHLARGLEPEITTAVVDAATRLADDMELGQLLRYLTDWLSGGDPRRAEVAADIALKVMSRTDDTRVRPGSTAGCERFWREALGSLPSATMAELVRSWLRLLGGDPAARAVQVLLTAADNDLRRVGQLFYATRPPGGDDGDDAPLDELFRHVRLRLDELLSPQPTTEQEA